jgi:hypothetical protein
LNAANQVAIPVHDVNNIGKIVVKKFIHIVNVGNENKFLVCGMSWLKEIFDESSAVISHDDS